MSHTTFVPDFFQIPQLKHRIGIANLLKDHKLPVTFNQLMKCDSPMKYIFVFDDKSVEIPCLASFCHYFQIQLFQLCEEDIKEVKNHVKHSQMVCVPADCPDIGAVLSIDLLESINDDNGRKNTEQEKEISHILKSMFL